MYEIEYNENTLVSYKSTLKIRLKYSKYRPSFGFNSTTVLHMKRKY